MRSTQHASPNNLSRQLMPGIRGKVFLYGVMILLGCTLVVSVGIFLKGERGIQSILESDRTRLAVHADPSGFTRASPEGHLVFPNDFGPHPDYQTEWWYYTGNLEDSSGRRFGYQLTFFRRALLAPADRISRQSDWGTDQVYLAHLALTNVAGNKHISFERLSRGAAGLAGAASEPFEVWLEDWEVRQTAPAIFNLQAIATLKEGGNLHFQLELKDEKGPVLQGKNGYSQKGPDPGNASYYYSQPRLLTTGQIELDGVLFQVQGYSWMDHEFSTSALAPDQVGWDWFSIQFDDQTELMVYQIRKKDGSIDPFSSGIWIDQNGDTIPLVKEDFIIRVLDQWTSPGSGGVYPSRWEINVPKLELTLQLEPLVPDQEMDLTYRYWEGAVQLQGKRAGNQVGGSGFVELTGYAGSMTGEF